jgi:hypothetical protein
MMKKEEVRLRLHRVLSGSRNVEHLNRLFNWLRFRSHGWRTIKEIGDFAAHQEKRDQGISWKRAKDIFFNARLFLTAIRLDNNADRVSLEDFHAALFASLDLIGPQRIKRDLGMGFEKARKILQAAVKKSADAKGLVKASWGPDEKRVVQYVQSRFSPAPVFDQVQLFDALSKVLLKEKLIETADLPRLEAQMGFIAMYVVSLMHLCELDLGSAGTITLRAAYSPQKHRIEIAAAMPNVVGKVEIATPLFATDCCAEDWCDPDCGADFDQFFTWNEPIELDEMGRLREMT